MLLSCPNCPAQYDVPEGAIPAEGRMVKCSSCAHEWHAEGETPAPPAGSAIPATQKDEKPPSEDAGDNGGDKTQADAREGASVDQDTPEDNSQSSLAEKTAQDEKSDKGAGASGETRQDAQTPIEAVEGSADRADEKGKEDKEAEKANTAIVGGAIGAAGAIGGGVIGAGATRELSNSSVSELSSDQAPEQANEQAAEQADEQADKSRGNASQEIPDESDVEIETLGGQSGDDMPREPMSEAEFKALFFEGGIVPPPLRRDAHIFGPPNAEEAYVSEAVEKLSQEVSGPAEPQMAPPSNIAPGGSAETPLPESQSSEPANEVADKSSPNLVSKLAGGAAGLAGAAHLANRLRGGDEKDPPEIPAPASEDKGAIEDKSGEISDKAGQDLGEGGSSSQTASSPDAGEGDQKAEQSQGSGTKAEEKSSPEQGGAPKEMPRENLESGPEQGPEKSDADIKARLADARRSLGTMTGAQDQALEQGGSGVGDKRAPNQQDTEIGEDADKTPAEGKTLSVARLNKGRVGAGGAEESGLAALPKRDIGFGGGFLFMLSLIAICGVLYYLAPELSERIPATKGFFDAYTRIMGDALDTITGFIRSLLGMAG